MTVRRGVTATVAVLALLALAACNSGGEDRPRDVRVAASPRTTSGPLPTLPPPPPPPPPPPAVWPLTGLPSQGLEQSRGVLVAKVDDTSAGRPQVGLASADLVVQEPVEGGLTRLAVFFQSADPPAVGPVRSVRTSDLSVVAPANGVLVASGGSGVTLQTLRGAGTQVLDGGSGYARDRGRRAPYNVLVSLPQTRAALGGLAAPGRPYLPWATAASPTTGSPASAAEVGWPSGRTRWAYDPAAGWVRDGDLPPDRFAASNVLMLRVALRDTGQRDAAGSVVPEVVLTGSGDATLLTGPTVVTGHWSKGGPTEPIQLSLPDGTPIALAPGRTWLALVPSGGSVSVS